MNDPSNTEITGLFDVDSPQKEHGYTPIANELMEALTRYRIPGEQMQCLLFILRKTYGFNKKEDMISNSQFVENTGLKKGNVSRAIRSLVDKNIVIKSDNRSIPTYRFNKHYRAWKLLSKKQPVIKSDTAVIKSDNRELSKVMDTKDISTKEDITKEEIIPYGQIIDRLNSVAGRSYKQTTPITRKHISARWNEGFRLEDFFRVIDTKVSEWKGDSKYSKYIRPETLFGTKFEGYLQTIPNPLDGVVSEKAQRTIENLKDLELT